MNKTPTTTMRLDEGLKASASEIFNELGLNMTSAVTVFLKAVVRTGGIPFDVKLAEDNVRGEPLDFVAEYLSPVMSGRNEINRVGLTPDRLRSRLAKRSKLINQGRREVAW